MSVRKPNLAPFTPTTPPSPSFGNVQARLAKLSSQMAPQQASRFPASVVPKAPEDPLFGLMAAYRKDPSQDKVDLGIGAYRDDDGKPWVLPAVKQVYLGRLPCIGHQPICTLGGLGG